ncbi:TIGR03503 family protein [Methylomagnum ishizawai]|uniref:TIGR03503 family protein n=1 Tax=Methylomagnum ishizawai TaxID=1760988 RepID=A0A1Y6D823_9GAMM|nr:VWA domain-containing protein [Methylomagnum ishizawai]SMF96923.1 TIGR03503 family protein [Methylomagnum ishizawai]
MALRILHSFALLLWLALSAASAQEPPSDIRVLIDTSGSMKQNDPRNLRIPALKLLIELLPMGSRAGIWLFDAAPQVLVPTGTVDAAWKARALQSANKIHSRGQFTHIEAALDAAAQSWFAAGGTGPNRGVLLLTDGMVDVSKQAEASAASRSRIVAELLPKLQAAGVHVDTIALSEQSDRELLRQLSLATDGWNETADSADALQRSFVRMFNQVAPQDGLPLRDNRFKVDAGIQEFTVLVLLKPDAQPTRLRAPGGAESTQAHAPPQTRWVHEPGYDLVTVSHPAAGEWKLVADEDPDNRVLVVTDLKLEVTPIPNFVAPAEWPTVAAGFSEHGQAVARQDFLGLLKVGATLAQGTEHQDFPMPQDAQHPERFTLDLAAAPAPGSYTLTVTADGQTFQRVAKQNFQVLEDLVRVAIERDTQAEPHTLNLTIAPNPQAIQPDSLVVKAKLAGQSTELAAEREGAAWRYTLPLAAHGTVNVSAQAKTLDGKNVAVPIKPLVLGETAPAEPPHGHEPILHTPASAHGHEPAAHEPAEPQHEPVQHTPASAQDHEPAIHEPPADPHDHEPAAHEPPTDPHDHEPATHEPPADPHSHEPAPEHHEPVATEPEPAAAAHAENWPVTAAEALGINAAFIAAGFFAHRQIKQRKAAALAKLLGKLSP